MRGHVSGLGLGLALLAGSELVFQIEQLQRIVCSWRGLAVAPPRNPRLRNSSSAGDLGLAQTKLTQCINDCFGAIHARMVMHACIVCKAPRA